MKDKIETYAEVAKEIDKIMKNSFGERYDNEILESYANLATDERGLDKLMSSYDISISERGYEISEDDIHRIALSEINKQMQRNTPAELETQKIMYSLNNEVAEAQNTFEAMEDSLNSQDAEEIQEMYSEIMDRLDTIQNIYFTKQEELGIDDNRYHEIMDKIENIREQVAELAEGPELGVYEQEEKGSGLLQQLKEITPTFKETPVADERDMDEVEI